jgi:hypothetical protein
MSLRDAFGRIIFVSSGALAGRQKKTAEAREFVSARRRGDRVTEST